MNIQLVEGRWYNKEDRYANEKSLIINTKLAKELFGSEPAIGKIIGENENKKKVVGVVTDVKAKGDYSTPRAAIYLKIDTGDFHWLDRMLTGFHPMPTLLEVQYKMAGIMKIGIEIEYLTNKRKISIIFLRR
jgi:putative ABC transport system permease protein